MEPLSNTMPTLPQLILQHTPVLARRTAAQACAQMPWYRSQAPNLLDHMFARDYQQLAQMLQSADVATLRTYIEQSGEERLQMGASAESLIAVAALMEENVRRLIDTELSGSPTVAKDATRRVQAAIRNIRMILSGLNLRRLTNEHHQPH